MSPIPDPPDAVTVTTPADIADTDRLTPKSIVPAVPTVDPESFITIPEPLPTTPVRPLPSPTKDDAVIIPVVLILTVEINADAIPALVA